MNKIAKNFNIVDDMMNRTEKEIKNIKPISILLMGKQVLGKVH